MLRRVPTKTTHLRLVPERLGWRTMTDSQTRAPAVDRNLDRIERIDGIESVIPSASLLPPQQLGGLISRDASMFKAFDLIRTAGPTNVNVLILGENGTGKELAAAAIHELSLRRDRPFVKINC